MSLDPFLKWAGGKRWLVSGYSHLFPNKYSRYVEPFLGGGAVFFGLRPANAVLSDRNDRLIETYIAIRNDWKSVWKALRRHHRNHSADYYYVERAAKRKAPHERAAQFLYLNRTCWNGLYRVNKRGEFNVPIGTKNWAVSDEDDFASISTSLLSADLKCEDFGVTIDKCTSGDFVFADPPYTVAHNFNGFVKYNETFFTWNDQVRLRDKLIAARRRGANIVLTNADHPSIHKLYEEHGEIIPISRFSIIGSKSQYRKATSELVIRLSP